MWLFALNAYLLPPVAFLGMSAIVAAGTGCVILSALPVIVIVVKSIGHLICSGLQKLYRCCSKKTAAPRVDIIRTPSVLSFLYEKGDNIASTR